MTSYTIAMYCATMMQELADKLKRRGFVEDAYACRHFAAALESMPEAKLRAGFARRVRIAIDSHKVATNRPTKEQLQLLLMDIGKRTRNEDLQTVAATRGIHEREMGCIAVALDQLSRRHDSESGSVGDVTPSGTLELLTNVRRLPAAQSTVTPSILHQQVPSNHALRAYTAEAAAGKERKGPYTLTPPTVPPSTSQHQPSVPPWLAHVITPPTIPAAQTPQITSSTPIQHSTSRSSWFQKVREEPSNENKAYKRGAVRDALAPYSGTFTSTPAAQTPQITSSTPIQHSTSRSSWFQKVREELSNENKAYKRGAVRDALAPYSGTFTSTPAAQTPQITSSTPIQHPTSRSSWFQKVREELSNENKAYKRGAVRDALAPYSGTFTSTPAAGTAQSSTTPVTTVTRPKNANNWESNWKNFERQINLDAKDKKAKQNKEDEELLISLVGGPEYNRTGTEAMKSEEQPRSSGGIFNFARSYIPGARMLLGATPLKADSTPSAPPVTSKSATQQFRDMY